MKTCRVCKVSKPHQDYNRNTRSKDGLKELCRPCNRAANKEVWHRHKDKYKERHYKRLKENVAFRVTHNLRTRIRQLVRDTDDSHYSKYLACTVEQLKAHLQNLFQPGMTWDNYGDWHVDHKYPLSLAYREGPEAFAKACHYTNLQPLWAEDNLKKSNSIEI